MVASQPSSNFLRDREAHGQSVPIWTKKLSSKDDDDDGGGGGRGGRGMCIGQRTTLEATHLVFRDRVSHSDLQIS